MRQKLVKLCLLFSYVAQNSLHFDEFLGVKKIPTAKRRRSIYEFRNQGKAESRRHCQGWECKAERDAQVKSGLIFSSAENSLGVKLTVLRLVEKKKKTSSPRPNSFISSRLFLFSVLSALLLSRFCWGSSVASNHHRGQTFLFWKYMWTDFLVRNSFEIFLKIFRQNEWSFAGLCLNHNKYSRIFPTYFWMTKLNLIFVKKIHKIVFFENNKKIRQIEGGSALFE